MDNRAFEEMLDEFRALGGTADNIRLGEGVHGRGIFPIDPARPVAIRIPENLLMDAKDAIFVGGEFRVGPEASIGVREALFLQSYQNRFSWGGGGRAEMERVISQAQALPEELRNTLLNDYRCGDWFLDASDHLVQDRFLNSRCIHYKGRVVLMPVVELLNHSPSASYYDTKNGIACEGVFPGEVCGKYADTDPFGIFWNWGFACEQPLAFSFPLRNRNKDNSVQIGRDLADLSSKNGIFIPEFSRDGAEIRLKFLMMGSRKHPRIPRGVFYKIMREAGGKNIEEAFDLIRHANLNRIAGLFALLENVEGPMVDTLRRVARFQLQELSFCFGVREI